MTRQEAAEIARASKMSKQPSLSDRFWSKVDIKNADECWNWTAAVRRPEEGYGAFWLNGRHQASNRVAWMLTHGEIPELLQVLHKCDNPKCCNPEHLFLGTNKENNADKVNKNRHAFGSKNGFSKLTEEQALYIKSMRHKCSAKNLSEMFNVAIGTIYDVWIRRWKHLEVPNA